MTILLYAATAITAFSAGLVFGAYWATCRDNRDMEVTLDDTQQ